jgi:hypothetical protein
MVTALERQQAIRRAEIAALRCRVAVILFLGSDS